MKSEEALETLFDLLCEREHTNSEHNFWLKLYQSVKEDLEVLEVLKDKIICITDDTSFITKMLTKEEKELLKEWLENDKIN